jgi:two-component system, chemotaxis family, protein-glutamate methylesterase/glutaminase
MVNSNSENPIRILIVDDSISVREFLKEIFRKTEDMTVIGEAENGKEAIEKALKLKPDLITMDITMPIMSGYEAIEYLMANQAVPILVVSSQDDAQSGLKAIAKGALDLFPKSEVADDTFVEKVRLLSRIKVITHLNGKRERIKTRIKKPVPKIIRPFFQNKPKTYTGIVAIASSTGGPQALTLLLSSVSNNFPCPIVIAQHIARGFVDGLVGVLSNSSNLKVKKGEQGESLDAGVVYISPASKHMIIDGNRKVNLIKHQPLDIYFPSCNRLLSSVADAYRSECFGIILTGMGRDGVLGMQKIKEAGGKTVAQDESTSIVFGMPREAIAHGCIDVVAPIQDIQTILQGMS